MTTASFWARVEVGTFPGACWLWTGGRTDRGYGKWTEGGVQRRAHRLAYEWMVGPIPDGMTLDHLCRVRLCVNPKHLEPVTNRENVLRGDGRTAVNARKTVCIRGHELRVVTKGVRAGRRRCRECQRVQPLRASPAEPVDPRPIPLLGGLVTGSAGAPKGTSRRLGSPSQ